MNNINEETLREQVREYLDKNPGLSLSAIAKGLGISSSSFSLWLQGTYKGNVEKIMVTVESYLQRQKEKAARTLKQIPFVDTSVARKVFEVARLCHIDGEIGVCVGMAGIGKTASAQEYVRQNPDTILIEADLGYTATVLFSELSRWLGLNDKGALHSLFEGVVERLKGTERLIIIDEAEHLPYKALELLRRVYDKANVGILLIGMPRLTDNLRGKAHDFKQLYSRVGVHARLEKLKEQDSELIVKTVLPETNNNGIWKTFHRESNENIRVLIKLLKRAHRVAEINNVELSDSVIKEAARTLIL